MLKPDQQNWNLLVVDDEPEFCQLIIDFLEDSSFFQSIVMANTILEANQKMSNQHFDLVILDNHFPGKSGIEFLKQLKSRQLFKMPKIIFVSGALSNENLLDLIFLDIKNILVKPFSRNKLLAMIYQVMVNNHKGSK